MKRILILEPDEDQNRRLSQAIMAAIPGEAAISVATSVREACLLVAQRPHDLAFLRIEDLLPARRALHSLQPNLALVAVAADEAHGFPGIDIGRLRGIVSLTYLDEGLRRVLGVDDTVVGAVREPPLPTEEEVPVSATADTVFDAKPDLEAFGTGVTASPTGEEESRLRDLLDNVAGNEKILGGIVTAGHALLAKGVGLSDEQVQTIVLRVIATWQEGNTALLQFIRPPDEAADLLLYSRPVSRSQLLTLAAAPAANVSRLRRAADELAARLGGLDRVEPITPQKTTRSPSSTVPSRAAVTTSYALVWRPRRALPAALQDAVGQALQSVADTNSCTLHHREVTAALVHIVVTCPGRRSSAWMAQLFKQGVQARIQMQYGVPAKLWSRGFYAKDGDEPLSRVELELFARAASED